MLKPIINSKPGKWLRRLVRQALQGRSFTVLRGPLRGLRRPGGAWVVRQFLPLSREERFLIELQPSLEGKVVYDIGGFEGLFSLYFSRASRGAAVHTFEPNPTNQQKILRIMEINAVRNQTLHPVAVGSQRGVATMTVDPTLPARGSLDASVGGKLASKAKVQTIDVPVEVVDDYARQHQLPAPQFVKIDVEGFELHVLEGMTQIVEEYHPDFLIEVHGSFVADGDALARGVVTFLTSRGYTLTHLETDQSITPENFRDAFTGHLVARHQG